jgi:hypothetical protein
MTLVRCANGHLYNSNVYGDHCQVCGMKVVKPFLEGKSQAELEKLLCLREDQYVCGWLVCAEGSSKGQSFPIHAGRNYIGSGADMDVSLAGDDRVERHRHCILNYDAEKHEAVMSAGEGRGLTYLDGNLLIEPKPIEAETEITLGDSKLRYKAFCNPEFNWSNMEQKVEEILAAKRRPV